MTLKSNLIGIATSFLFSISAYATDVVTLSNGDWSPILHSKELKHHGYGSHIVTEAFGAVGIDVKYEFMPWKKAWFEAAKGIKDGSLLWIETEERNEHVYFSDPVLPNIANLFSLKTKPINWENYEDLKGMNLTIGVSSGYDYGDSFNAAKEAGIFKTKLAKTDAMNFKKLLSGSIDAFIVDQTVGIDFINRELSEADKQKIHFDPSPTDPNAPPLKLALSKKVEGNDEVLKKFNEGLKKLKESGKLDAILEAQQLGAYNL